MSHDLTKAMALAWYRYKRDYSDLAKARPGFNHRKAFAACLRMAHKTLRVEAWAKANPVYLEPTKPISRTDHRVGYWHNVGA